MASAAGAGRAAPAGAQPVNVDTLLAELLDLRVEDLGLNLAEIIYQGFQPREFILSIAAKATRASIAVDAHKKNMVYLGLICAARGSRILKIANSNGTSLTLRNRLNNLIAAYDIKEGRPDGPVTATLPRFLAVTALPVSKIIIRLPIRAEEVAEGYPLVLCMSHSGGLLTSGPNVPEHWFRAVAYGQYLMSIKFRANPTKAQVLQFVKIAAQSNLWTNDQKLAHLVAGEAFVEQ